MQHTVLGLTLYRHRIGWIERADERGHLPPSVHENRISLTPCLISDRSLNISFTYTHTRVAPQLINPGTRLIFIHCLGAGFTKINFHGLV